MLEGVQRRAMKIITEVEHPLRVRDLGLFSLDKRKFQGDLSAFQYLKRVFKKDRTDFLVGSVMTGQRVMVLN